VRLPTPYSEAPEGGEKSSGALQEEDLPIFYSHNQATWTNKVYLGMLRRRGMSIGIFLETDR